MAVFTEVFADKNLLVIKAYIYDVVCRQEPYKKYNNDYMIAFLFYYYILFKNILLLIDNIILFL